MNTIDEIMALIDWNRSESDQRKGISMAHEVSDLCLKCFFQPTDPQYGKRLWENCAIIISQRTDAQLRPYILDMLLWLRDLNWPGAEIIQQRLIQFEDVDWLAMYLNEFVPALVLLKEYSWLLFLSDLLKNEPLAEKLSAETKAVLSTLQRDGLKAFRL